MLKFRERTNTWPGFVDLFSNLVIILIFLLIVFVFLWTATNVFTTGGGAQRIAVLSQQTIEQAEQIEQLQRDEAQARELLIMARGTLEALEHDNQALQQEVATVAMNEERARELLILARAALEELEQDNLNLSQNIQAAEATKAERERQLAAIDATLAELVERYEQKLTDMRGDESSMREMILALEQQLRTAESQQVQSEELEVQKQALTAELSRLNELLETAEAKSAEQETYYMELSNRLNRALADKVAELAQMQDNLMDAEMRAALMGEFQSEFYRAIRTTLAGLPGVDVSSDRFMISSDILFATGSFTLSRDGIRQIGLIANVMKELENKIPQDVSWIIRVDGHTDIQPVVYGTRGFRNNTELSLLRARAMVNELVKAGVQQRRLIPSGFGELFPVAPGTDPASLQKNRRIELRLTNP